MSRSSEFESTDRYMSGWVASCVTGNGRVFVTDDGDLTQSLSHAAHRRWASEADALVEFYSTRANKSVDPSGFEAVRVAEVLS